ncbi:nuclease-related domain-containing protein [Bosea sp. ANAM02]|uniref:nuclease-related domain-containing protein n=1 Tax=Bosea sp. ANAM02 TaxID=2020412 RepID=UPI00140EAF85|nr:nuclease-related domain-containing protein [Bosea sp. ANAM02]BCB22006.1 hypothetical protein OCUBac02_49000 [Bosea sp. ANAM02]
MDAVLKSLVQAFENHWHALAAVIVLAAASVAYLLRDLWAGGYGPMIVWKIVDRLGLQVVHNAYLPHAGGVKVVDYIVLAGDTVVVIQHASLRGKITGQAHEPTWLAERGGVTSRIPNPLRQNYPVVEAIQERVGGNVEVVGLVAFIGDATFAKRRPDGVYTPRALRRYLQELSRRGTGKAVLDWNWFAGTLARGDQPGDLQRQRHPRKAPSCPTAIKLRHQGL